MEPLCPNFDLLPTSLSQKFNLVPSYPCKILSSNHRFITRNLRLFVRAPACRPSSTRNSLQINPSPFESRRATSCLTKDTRADSLFNKGDSERTYGSLIRSIARGVFGVSAAAAVVFGICCNSPALGESVTVAFPVSRAHEVIDSIFIGLIFNKLAVLQKIDECGSFVAPLSKCYRNG